MKRALSSFIIPILAVICSIALNVLSSTSIFDSFISSIIVKDKIALVKSIIEVINYLVMVLPISIQSIVRANNARLYKETLCKLGQEKRKNIAMLLSNEGLLQDNIDYSDSINIRLFRKRGNRLILEDKPGFYNKEIDGKLSFSIKKNEGLCVKAYREGHSMLENENASKREYNLTDRQKALAGQLQFIVAVPIIPDGSNTVTRVVCFDSFQKISKNGCEEGILKNCESFAYIIDSVI